jgi:hypothetical protein
MAMGPEEIFSSSTEGFLTHSKNISQKNIAERVVRRLFA